MALPQGRCEDMNGAKPSSPRRRDVVPGVDDDVAAETGANSGTTSDNEEPATPSKLIVLKINPSRLALLIAKLYTRQDMHLTSPLTQYIPSRPLQPIAASAKDHGKPAPVPSGPVSGDMDPQDLQALVAFTYGGPPADDAGALINEAPKPPKRSRKRKLREVDEAAEVEDEYEKMTEGGYVRGW